MWPAKVFSAWPICDLMRFLRIERKRRSGRRRAEKPFADYMWHVFNFSDQIYQNFDLKKKDNYVLFKTNGFAIREWIFGMGQSFQSHPEK